MLIGDIVKITQGPLVGTLARVVGTTEQRVVLVVELQGRQLEIEMDLDWIVATAPERMSVSRIKARGTRRWSSA